MSKIFHICLTVIIMSIIVIPRQVSNSQTGNKNTTDRSDILKTYNESATDYEEYLKARQSYWEEYSRVDSSKGDSELSEAEKMWNRHVETQRQMWDKHTAAMQALWQEHIQSEEAKWDAYVSSVEQIWGDFRGSTEKELVQYSDDKQARTYVNLEEGIVVVETVVEEKTEAPKEKAEEKIASMLEKTMETTNEVINEKTVDSKEISEAVKKPVFNGRVTGKDGKKRLKYAVSLKLAPGYLQNLAKPYIPLVEKYSREYNLDPSLVMAIIETESAFNPKAESYANAIGLMQIVPKYAGMETWNEIYGKPEFPNRRYLFDPENNIKHGCCYLNLLRNKYWKDIPEGKKKDYLTIASYNCGPHNVQKMVLKKYGNPDKHTDDKMYDLLTRYTPKETRNYLRKVTSKREKWMMY